MTRTILIDNHSGAIWGDSADLEGKAFTGSALQFAAALDASIGGEPRTYSLRHTDPRTDAGGYHVYAAPDVDVLPIVEDGQSEATIGEVIARCRYEGMIEWRDAEAK